MTVAVGVDARQRKGYWAVRVEEGGLRRIEKLDDLDALLEAASDAEAVAFNVPIGHEDPEGGEVGWRACDREARELLGDEAHRLLPMPPPAVYEVDHYHTALELCRENDWPELPEPIWHARERVETITQAAADDERIVEIHPEVSFTKMHGMHGGEGPLEHYGGGWAAIYERLQLLHEEDLRPARSLGGVGRGANPKDVVEASVAAWSAHRVATDQAGSLPEDPPTDPRSGRRVAIWY